VFHDPGLNRWRLAATFLIGLSIGLPLAAPFVPLMVSIAPWDVWSDWQRLVQLARNTLLLAAGTIALALPAGTAFAVLLYRTDLHLRHLLRSLAVLALFVPLPLLTSAWQAALGTGGWLPSAIWTWIPPDDPDYSPSGITWKPWGLGMGPAIWVHALASLPWVILIVGQGLTWVERELEEDALMDSGPWGVLWRVTLPRARVALGAAALWVVLPIITEITVTDMMQVRTFAEETYTQMVEGDLHGMHRSVAVMIPLLVLVGIGVATLARRLERHLPPLESRSLAPIVFCLGWKRWIFLAIAVAGVGLMIGVPLASLVWKAGLGGIPQQWSGTTVWNHLVHVLNQQSLMIFDSFAWAALSGIVTASLAILVCWLAVGSRWFWGLILALVTVAWILPAPIVGFGLKTAIKTTINVAPFDFVGRVLYFGPSPLPIGWAYLVRLFPFAVAVLWPIVRLIPVELRDAARVDGARPRQVFTSVVIPLLRQAICLAAAVVAILSLGELGASKIAATPGSQTLAHVIFEQMHNGVSNDLAALCLILLAFVVGGGLFLTWFGKLV
jgi:iron(III) transport system permease protein